VNSFEQHRPLLWSIAYRMLGSAAEAEDIVQEAYLRAQAVRPETITSERAYFSSIVTRLCLDHWKSARVKRETYVGPWLPEPVRFEEAVDPASISLAFLVLLESLTPLERAVYLLSQVFDYEHGEIAAIVGRDEAACRQLLHRARERIRAEKPRFTAAPESHRKLLEQFARACHAGDLTGLEQLLSAEVSAWSDGGGKVHAAQRPVVGAHKVAALYVGLHNKAPAGTTVRIEEINGLPALVLRVGGKLAGVIDVETDGQRIVAVRTIVNPDKLARLAQTRVA
jgi:RNA polymerase sigma-70 factor, ECF subfamily